MRLHTFAGAAALVLAMAGSILPHTANAADSAHAAATLKVDNAWIRLLPAGLPAAGYVVLINGDDTPRKLVSASSADYGMVMLHQSMQDSGMSHMREVTGIDIPAHGKATLAPGGYHLMLMQPLHALKAGQKATIVLHFADGATQAVAFDVRPANSDGG